MKAPSPPPHKIQLFFSIKGGYSDVQLWKKEGKLERENNETFLISHVFVSFEEAWMSDKRTKQCLV